MSKTDLDRTWVKVHAGYRGQERHVLVKIGEEYVVEPLNPRNKKNRGRHCLVIGFHSDEEGKDIFAMVKYLDNNKVGRYMDLGNLIPVNQDNWLEDQSA